MPRDPNAPPPPPPTAPPKRNAALITLLCTAAAGACLSLTKGSEGERLKPYRDPAHIVTWCYGETQGSPKAAYSSAECAELLQGRLARDYAPRVAACLPELADQRRIKMFAAFLDAAYNAGPVAVCNSRMARSVHAGQLAAACDGFYGWYTTARDRRTGQRIPLKGLVTRRGKEAALCREGL